jgi:uncharacterized protein
VALHILPTAYHSLSQGSLPEGCLGCVRGEKLVLFITGICPAQCFFCPLSEQKKNHDVIFANEQEVTEQDIACVIAEAKAHGATGAGITGGDPLTRLFRTCTYIKALKEEFGKEFHIHLYTPLILVNETTLARLYEAGLDEIRFHPFLDEEKFWDRLKLARKYNWSIGIEIPIFPDKISETKRLVDYAHEYIDFINLNELEISERSLEEFEKRGYHILEKSSYAITGSKQAAREIMRYAQRYHLPVHFCTSKLKDRIQMGNRIIRRAQTTAQPFDSVDEEGLLTRGAIYCSYKPDYNYGNVLKLLSPDERKLEMDRLQIIYGWLKQQGMPEDGGRIDDERLRIILNQEALRSMTTTIKKKFPGIIAAIVKEYPTSDAFLVELEEL